MPYLKCEPCRARMRCVGEVSSTVEHCPLCDEPMQPVVELTEVVGFRTVDRAGLGSNAPESGHQRIADAVGAVIAERRARRATARLDADRGKP